MVLNVYIRHSMKNRDLKIMEDGTFRQSVMPGGTIRQSWGGGQKTRISDGCTG